MPGKMKEKLASWWQYTKRIPFLTTAIVFFAGGIIFWGGFHWTLEITNTEKFCISCHEMQDNVYEEYKKTVHYNNRTGVRATCPDCHVPKVWIYKIRRKIQASNEVYHKLMGTISTPEKFEAHRMAMAERTWKVMKDTDSRECRNCHKFDHMDYEAQDKRSAKKHKKGLERGQTCIDCHKGIAHKLPDEYEED